MKDYCAYVNIFKYRKYKLLQLPLINVHSNEVVVHKEGVKYSSNVTHGRVYDYVHVEPVLTHLYVREYACLLLYMFEIYV